MKHTHNDLLDRISKLEHRVQALENSQPAKPFIFAAYPKCLCNKDFKHPACPIHSITCRSVPTDACCYCGYIGTFEYHSHGREAYCTKCGKRN